MVIILVSSGTCLAYKVLQSWVMTLNENDIGCLLNFKWRVYSWQDLTLLPESDALYLYLKTKNGSKITIPIAAFKPSDDVRAFVESRTAH